MMSEYAEIENGKVINVLVIDDEWTDIQAQEFLANVSSNVWVKTPTKVGKSYEYHEKEGIFTIKKPFQSWVLDVKRKMYLPPISKPIAIAVGYIYVWSDSAQKWVKEKIGKL